MREFKFVKRINESATSEKMIVKLPQRSTAKSAGYDFFVIEDVVCKSHEITRIQTGIKAYMEDDDVLFLFNRSSNPVKKGLIVPNGVGVIDADYVDNPDNEGEISGLFYNILDEDVTLKAGEKMMQGVFSKYEITDNDNAEGERTGGFGSTGN